MICKQCGYPIPSAFIGRESFRCPECGKAYYKRSNSSQGNTRQAPQKRLQPHSRRSSNGFKRFIAIRNNLLLISLVLGLIYVIAQIANVTTASNAVANSNPESAEELGYAIGTSIGVGLLMPNIILSSIAVVFNGVAWFMSSKWATLTAAILYVVGGILGFSNFFFLLPSLVLCFIAYSKMRNGNR